MTLIRCSIAFFIIFFPSATTAENLPPKPVIPKVPDLPCVVAQGTDSCTKFVGCFGDDGLYFYGHARGRGQGQLRAKRNDGVICEGHWVARNSFGAGQADFECTNGEKGRVLYTLQDDYTGTAIGSGKTENKIPLQMWSGKHLIEYFSSKDSEGRPILSCGPNEALIS